MILCIADSLRKADIKDLDFSFEAPALESREEGTEFTGPVYVKGTAVIQAGRLELDVTVRTTLLMACTRCLDPFRKELDLEIREVWAREIPEDDLDTLPLSEGDTVDLADLLTKDIISSLPMQALCSEHCRGLCQECGANLNREACDCGKEQADVRFAALKDLFKEV